MIVAKTNAELHAALAEVDGQPVAIIPTMGALHAGHLSLVALAKTKAQVVVLSIFVNPLQFAAGEDLEKYPRPIETDLDVAENAGVDIVFNPAIEEIYPPGSQLTREEAGPVGELFEGENRPGHFDGVLTVVARLFDLVQPDIAVFGAKDAQQLFLVRQLANRRNLSGRHPLQIIEAETVRAEAGLALSSRNQFLTPEEFETALVLNRALLEGATEETPKATLQAAASVLESSPTAKLEYLALVDEETFLPVTEDFHGRARLLVAAKIGETRLIDNLPVDY
jgi:pantoate--beta-alanine ligase